MLHFCNQLIVIIRTLNNFNLKFLIKRFCKSLEKSDLSGINLHNQDMCSKTIRDIKCVEHSDVISLMPIFTDINISFMKKVTMHSNAKYVMLCLGMNIE